MDWQDHRRYIIDRIVRGNRTLFSLGPAAGPTAIKQKRFWGIMLFIFSLILGLPIESSIRMETQVNAVRTELHEHEDQSALHDRFHEIYDQYAGIFSSVAPQEDANARRLLKAWGDTLIDYLNEDFKSGSIPIPLERTPGKIKDVYVKAEKSIIATNVGARRHISITRSIQTATSMRETITFP